jgi:hypothetical protein
VVNRAEAKGSRQKAEIRRKILVTAWAPFKMKLQMQKKGRQTMAAFERG